MAVTKNVQIETQSAEEVALEEARLAVLKQIPRLADVDVNAARQLAETYKALVEAGK